MKYNERKHRKLVIESVIKDARMNRDGYCCDEDETEMRNRDIFDKSLKGTLLRGLADWAKDESEGEAIIYFDPETFKFNFFDGVEVATIQGLWNERPNENEVETLADTLTDSYAEDLWQSLVVDDSKS